MSVIVYAVVDASLCPASPLGDSIDTFVRREDAERLIANVKRDDPQLASHLRVVERELEAGGRIDSNKVVGGQLQTPVRGSNSLKSTKGTLSLVFRGVLLEIKNVDPTKQGFSVGYGTWQIQGATGIYKGWKGGGRWADASTPSAHNFEWNGFVTH